MEGIRTNNSRTLLLVLMVGLVLLFLLPSIISLPMGTLSGSSIAIQQETKAIIGCKPLAGHAAKHIESQQIWDWLNTNDIRFCRWDCDDGRTRYACWLPGNKLAMAVEDATNIITAFFTNEEYAHANIIDNPRCHRFMNGAHP